MRRRLGFAREAKCRAEGGLGSGGAIPIHSHSLRFNWRLLLVRYSKDQEEPQVLSDMVFLFCSLFFSLFSWVIVVNVMQHWEWSRNCSFFPDGSGNMNWINSIRMNSKYIVSRDAFIRESVVQSRGLILKWRTPVSTCQKQVRTERDLWQVPYPTLSLPSNYCQQLILKWPNNSLVKEIFAYSRDCIPLTHG